MIHGSQGLFISLTSVNDRVNVTEDEPEVKSFPTVPFYNGVDESQKLSRDEMTFLGNFIHSISEMINKNSPDDVESIRKVIEVRNFRETSGEKIDLYRSTTCTLRVFTEITMCSNHALVR